MRPTSAAGAIAIVILGFLIRLPGLTDPPLDFHPTRQYRAAIIARGYSLDLLGDLDQAERRAVEAAVHAQAPIEPPVMERLASWVYHLIGREDLAWARVLAVLAWSLGGLAIFWLAIQLLPAPASLASVAVWTFLPFTIRASQSFQPDPLMTALVAFTLAACVCYGRNRTIARGAIYGCGLAAALAVKAMSVFFLAPAIVAILFLGERPRRATSQIIVISIVALTPAAWYYSTLPLATDYGPFVQLLWQPQFWRDWGLMLGRVLTWPVLIAALAGTVVASGELRRLLIALFAGYAAFGIVFTHHIHTHDYYSLPLVPVVALGAGALVNRVAQAVRVQWAAGAGAIVVGLACFAAGSLSVVESQRSERKASLRAEVARYERIGQLVRHSTRVLGLDGAYGLPLSYHGYVVTASWPLSGDIALLSLTGGSAGSADARLKASGSDFFVCTLQPELDAQPDLQGALDREHPLLARDGAPDHWAFVVFDLQRGILSTTPAHLSMFTHVGAAAALEATVSLFAPAGSAWTVQAPEGSGLTVRPTAGTGPVMLRVTAAAPASEEDRMVNVTVHSAGEGATTFEVHLRAAAGPDNPPFGFVDTPPDPVTLGRDPIVFQGWAIDDTSMQRVWVGYADASGRVLPLGDAHRDGRRPDVAAMFPTAHDLYKAAWVFTLNPNEVHDLPRPINLRFLAEDGRGQRAEIGRRTVR